MFAAIQEQVPGIIVVWDLDETIAQLNAGTVTFRNDLIEVIGRLKAIGVKNILWTMGSLLHLIDMTSGTPLQYCFDDYLWHDHCKESFKLYGCYKHVKYLQNEAQHDIPLTNIMLIDDNIDNLSSYTHKIHINQVLENNIKNFVSANYVFRYVERMASGKGAQ